MAQQDAMEQVKEVVRQLIRYRFWIAISAAALFGLIAYFVGSGPVRDAAAKETANIKKAETEVKNYKDPSIPTAAYEPLVQEKTQVLTKDVNAAWKTLYDRQAPLLTWPDTVQERFQKWGRKWPENVDAGRVIVAQVDYIAAYKDYVDMVYKTFKPFDYETGEGIVAAPPKDALLRPAVFSDEKVPGLSKIWSAQERLWIQRTLFEVIAQVNKNATKWDNAIIRQIEAIEVGNPNAQDQHSLAKNEELTEAEKIPAPGETEEAAASAPTSGASGMMSKMGGMMGGMAGGGAKQDSEGVYYVKSGNASQYRILPVQMTVLIDQDHVQDLLVELENSPMSIQVKDFELQRPTARVIKPEKGTAPAGMGGMMGMGMMGMGRGMMGGTFGGNAAQMQNQMAGRMAGMMGMKGGMMGMGGPGGGGAERKGTDVRTKNRAEERKNQEEKIKEAKGPALFDPYFDIVEVTVYGQARFFRPPPDEAIAEPSPGQTAAVGTAAAPAATPPSPDSKGATPAAAPAATTPSPDSKAATPAAADATNKSGAGTPAEKPATPPAGTPPKTDPASDAASKAAASPAPADAGAAAKTGDSAPKTGDSTAKPPAGSGDSNKPATPPAATPNGGDAGKPKS